MIILTGLALCALLISEWKAWRLGTWIFKPLASLGFVIEAFRVCPDQRFMIAGFALCFVGDVLLIARSDMAFKGGVGIFLLGHVFFIAGFFGRGSMMNELHVLAASVIMVPVGLRVLHWLWPKVPSDLRPPVAAYVIVISVMVITALGVDSFTTLPMTTIGAVLFYVSDITVAVDKFVSPGLRNLLIGLPLYYVAQFFLVWSSTL